MSGPSKAVLITGCSTGIGHATALRLARADWNVYATARKPETLDELVKAGCTTMALDVCDEAGMTAALERIEGECGAVGVLINNAAYSQSGPIEEVPMADVRRQFETNVFGASRLIQLVLPKMRAQRWGKIVNVSSMGGTMVFPGGGYYHATKYALEAISDALRFEVKGFGVDTIIIQPGLIRTAFADNAMKAMDAAVKADGPYAKFNAAVAKATQEAYTKPPLSWLAAEPWAVARTIERAISAANPNARYKVAP
ncbi:MAG: SDR family NAD(P)-dependent oxidoreductase, partial [Candidatus Hydrogenedentota bacterium]